MSNNKKQTTVQLIYEAFKTSGRSGFAQWMMENENALKEMEKERMIEFGELCWKNLLRSDVIMRPRDVYNETYGGNK